MPDPLQELTAVGVDYDDVVGLLEADGIAKFESSWALVSAELGD
jgi:transaldolase